MRNVLRRIATSLEKTWIIAHYTSLFHMYANCMFIVWWCLYFHRDVLGLAPHTNNSRRGTWSKVFICMKRCIQDSSVVEMGIFCRSLRYRSNSRHVPDLIARCSLHFKLLRNWKITKNDETFTKNNEDEFLNSVIQLY
jgi:hypothetical protein